MKNIREKLKKKIRSRSGESIAETLVSLLIAALALVMLAGALTSSSKMITRGENAISKYQGEIEKAVNRSESAEKTESGLSVTFTENSDTKIKTIAGGSVTENSPGVQLEVSPAPDVTYYGTSFGGTSVGVYHMSGS